MNSEDHTHPNTTENNKEMVALLNSHSALAYLSKDVLKSYCNSTEYKGKLAVLQKMLMFADTQIYCSGKRTRFSSLKHQIKTMVTTFALKTKHTVFDIKTVVYYWLSNLFPIPWTLRMSLMNKEGEDYPHYFGKQMSFKSDAICQ